MTDLESRMKGYEQATRTELPRRLPVIIRVDGKGFSKYTAQLPGRPFDRNFMSVMESTAIALCQEIQGAQLAFIQSDEISVLVHGYKKFESEPWFGNQVKKMVSVSAAVASAVFTANSHRMWHDGTVGTLDDIQVAYFDSRVFVVPESDVRNYFLWRQRDGLRNSKQMFARQFFSHSELNKKSTEQMLTMCLEKGHDWSKLPQSFRNGRTVYRQHESVNGVARSHFRVDYETPFFNDAVAEMRLNQLLAVDDEER